MEEIEKRLKEAVDFVVSFFRSLTYFIFPWLIIRKIKSDTVVFPPLAFLAILSFFGLKFWTYFFVRGIVAARNSQLEASTIASLTEGKHPAINDFISIPGFEEIFGLTVPYILLVVILAKTVNYIARKNQVISDEPIDLGAVIYYFCGFLVLLFPIIFILRATLPDKPWLNLIFICLEFLAIPLYLFFMFWNAISHDTSLFKRFRFSFILSILVPVLTVFFMYSSLFLTSRVKAFENGDFSAAHIAEYQKHEIFQVRVADRVQLMNGTIWKVLIRTSREDMPQYKLYNYNLDGIIASAKRDSLSGQIYLDTLYTILSAGNDIDDLRNNGFFNNFNEDINDEIIIGPQTQEIFVLTNHGSDSSLYKKTYVQMNLLRLDRIEPQQETMAVYAEQKHPDQLPLWYRLFITGAKKTAVKEQLEND